MPQACLKNDQPTVFVVTMHIETTRKQLLQSQRAQRRVDERRVGLPNGTQSVGYTSV